jgi:hypothetical protein
MADNTKEIAELLLEVTSAADDDAAPVSGTDDIVSDASVETLGS